MNSENCYAVVLAGGYGERFWPASTMSRPKQLLSLIGDRTMLEMAVDRLDGLVPRERVLVLTSADLVEQTIACSPDLPSTNVIGEPTRRDTAAAVALACAVIRARNPEAVFCIVTADHVMGDLDLYRQTLRDAFELAAARDVLITIGITPTHPSTAFGYIEAPMVLDGSAPTAFREVSRFVEKPDAATAARYVDSGKFWWNSGMFIWSTKALAQSFRANTPQLADFIEELTPAVDTAEFSDELTRLFEPLEKISIDYALMEKADNIVMAVGQFSWDDVGSWPEVANHLDADEHDNSIRGRVETIESSGNIVLSEGRLTALVGVEDLIVVHTDDVTLVCHKDQAQAVKDMVSKLRQSGDYGDVL